MSPNSIGAILPPGGCLVQYGGTSRMWMYDRDQGAMNTLALWDIGAL
jgi:hypothetical protein